MDVADHFIDDAYMVHLDNISLTVTAASEANSTENTVEIRVDGGDTYLGANAAGLGTASGTLTFDWRPRHDAAQAVAFTEPRVTTPTSSRSLGTSTTTSTSTGIRPTPS